MSAEDVVTVAQIAEILWLNEQTVRNRIARCDVCRLAGPRPVPATGDASSCASWGSGRAATAQAVYARIYLDQLEAMRQLGLMPAP